MARTGMRAIGPPQLIDNLTPASVASYHLGCWRQKAAQKNREFSEYALLVT